MQKYFPDAKGLKKPPKITRCKKCEYIQNERNQVYKSFDLTPDYAHTFSTSYFHEEPILDVSTIEESIKFMKLHRVEKMR